VGPSRLGLLAFLLNVISPSAISNIILFSVVWVVSGIRKENSENAEASDGRSTPAPNDLVLKLEQKILELQEELEQVRNFANLSLALMSLTSTNKTQRTQHLPKTHKTYIHKILLRRINTQLHPKNSIHCQYQLRHNIIINQFSTHQPPLTTLPKTHHNPFPIPKAPPMTIITPKSLAPIKATLYMWKLYLTLPNQSYIHRNPLRRTCLLKTWLKNSRS